MSGWLGRGLTVGGRWLVVGVRRLAVGGRRSAVGGRWLMGWRSVDGWEGPWPNFIKKVGVIAETSLKKSKKTSRESVRRGREHCKNRQIQPIWNSSGAASEFNAGSPGSRGSRSWTATRDPPSTRAGGQDDGSLHKLPQIILYDTRIILIIL